MCSEEHGAASALSRDLVSWKNEVGGGVSTSGRTEVDGRTANVRGIASAGQTLFHPRGYEDERGLFFEVWPRRLFREAGLDFDWR